MGSDSHLQIPVIEFVLDSPDMTRGTEGWHHLCKRVQDACENYGCFEMVCDKISSQLRADTFSIIKRLFHLPLETKLKNVNPKPFHGYLGQYPQSPLYESIGLDDASNYDSLKAFMEIMWPTCDNQFCQTMQSMAKQLQELYNTIEKMIVDAYGLGEKLDSIVECKTLLRVMKYTAPPAGEYMKGIAPHTDKFFSTILCEDQISGLEIETKDGHWVKLFPSPGSFIYIVGDPLMAWSNGRMHPVKHRVMMSGNKDRYSMGIFEAPVEGTIIKAPKELVDEQHPEILKAFDYMDFINFSNSEKGMVIDSEKQVYVFAGI
ncbi:2-oxoglutarate-dependent dioxygenase [Quillaja saponaria]|uniref:2-oxoglutarate-dependent dioxygenase DAO n=1 Tax=Quillaja saponaria TaxID=32244 RepID=A0AAD7PT32_QUISA|nr:2-oxoglutarate-dependent dioxygenase [Quillaja saponaria]